MPLLVIIINIHDTVFEIRTKPAVMHCGNHVLPVKRKRRVNVPFNKMVYVNSTFEFYLGIAAQIVLVNLALQQAFIINRLVLSVVYQAPVIFFVAHLKLCKRLGFGRFVNLSHHLIPFLNDSIFNDTTSGSDFPNGSDNRPNIFLNSQESPVFNASYALLISLIMLMLRGIGIEK